MDKSLVVLIPLVQEAVSAVDDALSAVSQKQENAPAKLISLQGRKISRYHPNLFLHLQALTQPYAHPTQPCGLQTGHSQGNFGIILCAKLTAGDFALLNTALSLLACSSCYQGSIQFDVYYSTFWAKDKEGKNDLLFSAFIQPICFSSKIGI